MLPPARTAGRVSRQLAVDRGIGVHARCAGRGAVVGALRWRLQQMLAASTAAVRATI